MTADFTLTDEQQLLRDTARDLVRRECPSTVVRAALDDPMATLPFWNDHLRDWAALGDGSVVDLCLFVEELGYGLVPSPFVASAGMALPLLRAIDDDRADAVAAGDLVATVAMAGRDGTWVINDDEVRTFVLDADRSDVLAIVLPGPAVAVVERGSRGVRLIETLDGTRRTFEIDVLGTDRGSAVPIDAGALADAVTRATIVLAADLAGVARWLFEHALAYAKERVQFDRPIGSFQGLQWKLVDMSLDEGRANAAVYHAAMLLDAGHDERHVAAHVAKAAAGVAGRHAATDGVQIHGGIGFTWEHDVHLYLRRAYASDYLLGPSSYHHDRLADVLLSG